MEDVKLFDEDVVGDGSGGENLGGGNVKKQGEHGGEGALKRRALEGVVAKGGAGGEQAVMLDDGPGAVWNINKVMMHFFCPSLSFRSHSSYRSSTTFQHLVYHQSKSFGLTMGMISWFCRWMVTQ